MERRRIRLGWETERLSLMKDVLYAGRPSSLGEITFRFEAMCEEYWKRGCVSCSSGTTALLSALHWASLKRYRRILVPNMMLPLVISAIKSVYTKIKWVGVDLYYLQPNIDMWKKAIDSYAPCVVFLCHTGGLILPEVKDLVEYAHNRKCIVIEDFSHAHGAKMDNELAGRYGDVSVASMYITKVLTCGEGGIILCDEDKKLWFEEFVNAGKDRNEVWRRKGFNYRMSELNACIGLVDMRHREEIYDERRKQAEIYMKYGILPLQKAIPGLETTWYRFTILREVLPDGVKCVSKTFDYVVKDDALSKEVRDIHHNLLLYRGADLIEIEENAMKVM